MVNNRVRVGTTYEKMVNITENNSIFSEKEIPDVKQLQIKTKLPKNKKQFIGEYAPNLKLGTDFNYKHKYVPKLVIIFTLLHAGAVYGLYLIISVNAKMMTVLWAVGVAAASLEGVTLGAHRGFSHKAFKMTLAGKVMLIIFQTMSGQNTAYWWVRDHRLHHKFCDTDADPYNASRGFFFSHIGWLVMRKHPLVAEKGKTIDVSDLEACKVVMFQKKYFTQMFLLFCIVLPVTVPIFTWNENFRNSLFIPFVLRYVLVLNMTWCINSVAHLYGTRGFDKRISARQSKIADFLTCGDGWHNYHHTFPTDHAFSEFGRKGGFSTNFLYIMYHLGLVYDLKKTSRKVVSGHLQRHGDGTIGKEFSELKGLEYFNE